MENINSVRDVIQENEYMGKIDVKDAYLTVPVWGKHHKCLKFAWVCQWYQFKSLPFGLATATKVCQIIQIKFLLLSLKFARPSGFL